MPTAGEQIGKTIVKLTQENADLSREVERLEAIVRRIPLTADGVPVVPGDVVWGKIGLSAREGVVVWHSGKSADGLSCFSCGTGPQATEHTGYRSIDKCYSTREAAEKARDA